MTAVALTSLIAGVQYARLDRQRLAAWADGVVQQAAARLTDLRATLLQWGQDTGLAELFVAGESDELMREAEAWRRSVPGALAVHFRSFAQAVAPADEDPDLSFAGLDLVRLAAQSGRVTILEVHRVARADSHLAIAAPIADPAGDQVVGVAYVALPLTWLPEIDGKIGDFGSLRYKQRAGDDLVTIDHGRPGEVPQGQPDYVTPVPGSRLVIMAWRGRADWLAPAFLAQLAEGYVAVLAIAGIVLVWSVRRRQRLLVDDLAGILALIEDAAEGRALRDAHCRLAEPEGLRARVRPLLERLFAPVRAGEGGVAATVHASAATGNEDCQSGEKDEELAAELEAVPEEPRDDEPAPADGVPATEVPAEIFRANHIRGLADETLTEGLARDIGRAIGSEILARGACRVYVGRDNRASAPALAGAVTDGLRAAGCDVTALGLAPTPLLYFASRFQGETAGVMVTAGHHPPKYNGMKVVIDGEPLVDGQIMALRERILKGDFTTGEGACVERDLVEVYCEHVERDVTPARVLKVVLDCGNATASVIAPVLYRRLGCQVVELGCDQSAGLAGGRMIDPAQPDCLLKIAERVVAEGADLGLAFDTDADRLGVVDSAGGFIASDRLLLLFAIDVLSRYPGTDVIYDVACSRLLAREILRHGGRPVMWCSGHARLKAKLRERDALIAGDADGHMIFADRWFGFDDAFYAGARLIELLAQDPRPSAEVLAGLPAGCATPKLYVPLPNGDAAAVMAAVQSIADQVLVGADLKTLDGLRAEFDRGWGLVRAAGTRPGLALRFEADDEEALSAVQEQFRRLLGQAAPSVHLPF
ncbi:phosphomannomutase [Thioflavicoccus mobilis 8321]|uniref:phosphomannomutase n=1 Tax=Thioflavicoccus mobilis 8321 TaxID=765912 RepID=L0GW31_9GAMM|nr:phosphomannomutase/phosphoglucomutase [Thioflavicoccus mobilis]AGA89580.1 phosphomannomutase [Thioflavicoccus mobilis 8321]